MELTVKQIFCQILRILRRPRAAVVIVLYCGLNISYAADTQYSLVINMNVMVVPQVIIDTPVTFVWTFYMDFLHLFGDAFVLSSSAAYFARNHLLYAERATWSSLQAVSMGYPVSTLHSFIAV